MNRTRGPDTLLPVPHQPQDGRQHRSVSLFDAPWEVSKGAAEAQGKTRTDVIEELLDWWLRRPGAKLPERLPAEQLDAAFAEWQERQDGIRALALTLECPVCKVMDGPCLAGKAKQPTDMLHRPRLSAATVLYGTRP